MRDRWDEVNAWAMISRSKVKLRTWQLARFNHQLLAPRRSRMLSKQGTNIEASGTLVLRPETQADTIIQTSA